MKAIELLKINSKAFEKASKAGLHADDYRFINLYDDYTIMRQDGEKYSYIIATLSEKYSISESTLKRIVRRLESEVII